MAIIHEMRRKTRGDRKIGSKLTKQNCHGDVMDAAREPAPSNGWRAVGGVMVVVAATHKAVLGPTPWHSAARCPNGRCLCATKLSGGRGCRTHQQLNE
jgi:hypothetical protein